MSELRKEIEQLQTNEKVRQEAELIALQERQKIIQDMTRDVSIDHHKFNSNCLIISHLS